MAKAAADMHTKHREWNWAQWTRPRLFFGVATDERYRRWCGCSGAHVHREGGSARRRKDEPRPHAH